MAVKTLIKHKFHPSPRLSANQVADYLGANSTNRRNILRDAKFPPIVLLVPYTDAKTALVSHLARSHGDSPLKNRLQVLRRKAVLPETTDFERRNCDLCIEAIESFQSAEATMNLGKLRLYRPGGHFPKLKVSGVSISVSIDLLTERPTGHGQVANGAAMLIFSKDVRTRKNMEERCKAVSLLIYELLKAQAQPGQTYDPTMCMAIDVFKGVLYRAKGEQKQLLKTLGTSCDEVATLWPSVRPPASYNGPTIPGL